MKTEQEIRNKLTELEKRYNSDKIKYASLCSNIALLKYILND